MRSFTSLVACVLADFSCGHWLAHAHHMSIAGRYDVHVRAVTAVEAPLPLPAALRPIYDSPFNVGQVWVQWDPPSVVRHSDPAAETIAVSGPMACSGWVSC